MMRLAILTDDGARETGAAALLRAVTRHAPADIQPMVCSWRPFSTPFAFRSYASRVAALKQCLAESRAGAVHVTSCGQAAIVARQLARALDLPLIGSCGGHAGPRRRTAHLGGQSLRPLAPWDV